MTNIEQSNEVQFNRCAAVFKATGQRCNAIALVGKRTCLRHGALSTGPRTEVGRLRCAKARLVHGNETGNIRISRSISSAKLAVLEEIGFSIGLMKGNRTRGRRPNQMNAVYPELQLAHSKLIKSANDLQNEYLTSNTETD